MKKILFFVVILFSLGSTSLTGSNNTGRKGEYPEVYNKGYNSSEVLPKVVVEYLEKEYPGYTVIRSKRKNNGTYFVKIKFMGNKYHAYYRSLVFAHDGRVIKG